MSEDLGRGKRVKKPNPKMADDNGFQEVKSRNRKKKGKANNKKNNKAEENADNQKETEASQNDSLDAENNPGPSSPVVSENENMGRGSQSEDTSDVDSVDLERQNQELEELERQLEHEKTKRSVQEKRQRKNRMAEMRRITEERRKELQRIRSRNSDSDDVSPPKKPRKESPIRKVSKTKNGKGIKSSDKGKNKSNDEHGKLRNETETNKKRDNRAETKRQEKSQRRRKNSTTESSEGLSGSSSLDEFEETISKVKSWSKRIKQKNKQKIKSKNSSSERRSSQHDSSEGSSGSSTDSSPDSDSLRTDSSSQSDGERRKQKRGKRSHKKKGRPIKSGVKAKAHKIRLKTSELCAQAVLDEEHYPGNYSLEELSFEQLVAGELEICTLRDISNEEKQVRLKILKSLAYFSQTLTQRAIMEVYKAVILKVEKGLFTWSTDLVTKVEHMLDRAVSKINWKKDKERGKDQLEKEKHDRKKKELGIPAKNGERIIYCADYNKNKCDKESSHEGKFGGKECTKHHVCRVCLNTDKEKRFHPETDDSCPCKNR